MEWRRVIRTVRTVAMTALFLCAAVWAPPGFAAGATIQNKGQVDLGMKVFDDQKCSLCHSIAGRGNAKGQLDDVGSRLTADHIREWIINPAEMTKRTNAGRKPPMRAYPNLATGDVEALVAYLLSLKET
jgi:mono/diheme cytochrome c family protein